MTPTLSRDASSSSFKKMTGLVRMSGMAAAVQSSELNTIVRAVPGVRFSHQFKSSTGVSSGQMRTYRAHASCAQLRAAGCLDVSVVGLGGPPRLNATEGDTSSSSASETWRRSMRSIARFVA